MELRLRDEQVALAESYDALLEKAATPDRLRALGATGFDPDLWATFCRMGAPGIAVGESDGGDGAGLAEAAIICEQVGRHVAAVPFVDSCVASRLLATCGSPLTAEILAGDLVATVALRPAVDGTFAFVPSGSIADVVIGLDGDALIAVRTGGATAPLPNLADLPLAHRSAAGEVLATGEAALTLHQQALEEWRTLAAATLVGIADRALQIGIAYTKERTAFGSPLAAFQTIAHGLADCFTLVEGARILAQKAAWSFDAGTDAAHTLAEMAFYFAAESAENVVAKSLHFHGGYGFMLEYDIQLYYRRAKAWSLLHGDRNRLLDSVADRLYGPVA